MAKTIGKGMVHIETVDQKVLLAGLLGAISWNIITLILGLPTSSSHALMGGYRRSRRSSPRPQPPAICAVKSWNTSGRGSGLPVSGLAFPAGG